MRRSSPLRCKEAHAGLPVIRFGLQKLKRLNRMGLTGKPSCEDRDALWRGPDIMPFLPQVGHELGGGCSHAIHADDMLTIAWRCARSSPYGRAPNRLEVEDTMALR